MANGLLILYTKDVHPKLSGWIKDLHLSESAIVDRTCLEDTPFPLRPSRIQRFSKYRAVLIVISKDFLHFVESRSEEVFSVGVLLRPFSTMALFYGVTQDDVLCFHKAAFFSYDAWPKSVVYDWSPCLPWSVISRIKTLLTQQPDGNSEVKNVSEENDVLVTPRKINKNDRNVFVILRRQVSDIEKLNVLLEYGILREVSVKSVNPYVIHFDIPDDFIEAPKSVLNVHIQYEEIVLAIKQLKWESENSTSDCIATDAPLSALCSPEYSAMPYGNNLILQMKDDVVSPTQQLPLKDAPSNTKNTSENDDEEDHDRDVVPSLLELCATYGIEELTLDLFVDSTNQTCKKMKALKRSSSESPREMQEPQKPSDENNFEENLEDDITVTLRKSDATEVIKDASNIKCWATSCSPTSKESFEFRRSISLPDCLPAEDPKGLEEHKNLGTESTYLNMSGNSKHRSNGLMPHERLIKESLNVRHSIGSFNNSIPEHIYMSMKFPEEPVIENEINDRLSKSQQELLELIEAFKKGVKTLSEVENLFQVWHQKHGCSIDETVTLRHPGKKSPKPRKRQSFGLQDILKMIAGKGKRKKSKEKVGEQEKEVQAKTTLDCSATERHIKSLSKISSSSSSSAGSISSELHFDLKHTDRKRDSGNQSDISEELKKKAQDDPSTVWFLSLSPTSRMAYCPLPQQGCEPPFNFPSKGLLHQQGKAELIPLKKNNYPNNRIKFQRKPRDPSPDYITPTVHKLSPTTVQKGTGSHCGWPKVPPIPVGLKPLQIPGERMNQVKGINLRKTSSPGIKYFQTNSPQFKRHFFHDRYQETSSQAKWIGSTNLLDITSEPKNLRASSCPVLSEHGTDFEGESNYLELLTSQEGVQQYIARHDADDDKRDSVPDEPPPPLPPPRK